MKQSKKLMKKYGRCPEVQKWFGKNKNRNKKNILNPAQTEIKGVMQLLAYINVHYSLLYHYYL